MARGGRLGCWLIVLLLLPVVNGVYLSDASAAETFVTQLLLNKLRPSHSDEEKEPGNINKILSVPFERLRYGCDIAPMALENREFGYKRAAARKEREFDLFVRENLLPGSSLRNMHERWSKLASLHPIIVPASAPSSPMVDSAEALESAGKLMSDPTKLFDSFEIEVKHHTYDLRLFGVRNGEKKELYATKVGLGSPEFPTPRGKFFIARIFDDHPLWIPPQDRPWAWGQSPSRSVYGGHMMPLLSKRPEPGERESVDGDDWLAPRMRLIDSGAYRVHGTNSPWSVGSNQSHGCVRMKNETVEKLANSIKLYVGTSVRGEAPNGKYVDLARPVRVYLR